MWLLQCSQHSKTPKQHLRPEEPEFICWISTVISAEVGSPSPLSPSAALDPDYPDFQSSHHKVTLPASLSSSHYQLQLIKLCGWPVGDTAPLEGDVGHKWGCTTQSEKTELTVFKHTTAGLISGFLQKHWTTGFCRQWLCLHFHQQLLTQNKRMRCPRLRR